jgi:hypothetical protein
MWETKQRKKKNSSGHFKRRPMDSKEKCVSEQIPKTDNPFYNFTIHSADHPQLFKLMTLKLKIKLLLIFKTYGAKCSAVLTFKRRSADRFI